MSTPRLEQLLIETLAKHLPPSGAVVRLLDVGGRTGAVLSQLRADLEILPVTAASGWPTDTDSADAVVAYDCAPDDTLLASALKTLRPGGRLIIVNPDGEPDAALVQTLEGAGYTRILVETAAECPLPVGVLLRGEKPQPEVKTVDRVRSAAERDAAARARYLYLLIRQTPNKSAWDMQPEDVITWEAVAVAGENETVLLAFSSLPKALAFMQPAVLANTIAGVNKIAKFRWHLVQSWPQPMMLNPTDDILETNTIVLLPVDPATAEAPDE